MTTEDLPGHQFWVWNVEGFAIYHRGHQVWRNAASAIEYYRNRGDGRSIERLSALRDEVRRRGWFEAG